jgi:tRNA U34 5-carboxymethylaminomethyl modifying GTPase MnmE/TrmE
VNAITEFIDAGHNVLVVGSSDIGWCSFLNVLLFKSKVICRNFQHNFVCE